MQMFWRQTNFKLHLFTDALIIRKRKSYFERFFKSVYQISQLEAVPGIIYLMKLSFWSKFILTLVFYFYPTLSPSCRLFLLDYFTISGIGVQFNLLMFAIFLNAYLFIDQLYLSASLNDYIILPYKVLIERKWCKIFLKPCYKGQKIVDLVERVALTLGNAFAGVVIPSHLATTHICFIVLYITYQQVIEINDTSSMTVTILKLLILYFNFLTAYIAIHSFDNIYQLSMLIPALGGLINFIRIKQADNLLVSVIRRLQATDRKLQQIKNFCKSQENVKRQINMFKTNYSIACQLRAFYRYHTTVRVSIFKQNSILGFQLLAYIILYTPVNAYQLMTMLFTRIPILTIFIFCGMIFGQVTSIFGLHLLAVQYPQRIHKAGKLLNDIYVRLLGKQFNFRALIQCSHHLAILNVRLKEQRYGINYGPAHLVTMSTFSKVKI